MRRRARSTALALALSALAAGPVRGDPSATAAPPVRVVYAALTSRGIVNVYPETNTKPAAPLYSFALDPGTETCLVIDDKRNLFFADSYSTVVFEYAPGATSPSKRFSTRETPSYIAVKGDTLYVFEAQDAGGNASIAIYPNGAEQAATSLTDPAILYPQGLAVDGAGNVFAGWGGAHFSAGIGEFVGGKMPMRKLKLSKIFPLALAIDTAGDLVVDALAPGGGQTSDMYVFPPEQTSPSLTISGLPWFYQFSFTAGGSAFYAGDSEARSFQKYRYPSGRRIFSVTDPDARWGFSGIASAPAPKVGVW